MLRNLILPAIHELGKSACDALVEASDKESETILADLDAAYAAADDAIVTLLKKRGYGYESITDDKVVGQIAIGLSAIHIMAAYGIIDEVAILNEDANEDDDPSGDTRR